MLSIDGTFIVIFAMFLVFMLLMKDLYFAPLVKIKHERESQVDSGEQAIQDAVAKRDALMREQEQKLAEARRQAQQLLQEKREQAKRQAGEHVNKQRQEALSEIEARTANLKSAQERVYQSLQSDRDALAQTIVHKISGRQASAVGASSTSAV